MIYDKKCFSWGQKIFLLELRRADGYFEKCYVFIFSVSFQRTSSSSFFSLSSPAGRSSANINVRTQSPLNLGNGAQNGNVPRRRPCRPNEPKSSLGTRLCPYIYFDELGDVTIRHARTEIT